MDLSTLRREIEKLHFAAAQARRSSPSGSAFFSIYSNLGAMASGDGFKCVAEALSGAPDETKLAARALVDLVASAMESARAWQLDAERESLVSAARVSFENESIPLDGAQVRMANEPVRENRERIARATSQLVPRTDHLLAHRVELCQELAGELGFDSYEGLCAVGGTDFDALAAEAAATLAATEDAWRDLLDFGLRKAVGPIVPMPRGDAAAHDLARLERLALLDDIFNPRRLLSTTQSFLEAMGLSADAGGRILVDAEAKGHAQVLALRVPDEIVVTLGRSGGAMDYAGLLRALGEAHFLAARSPDLLVELKRGGDKAIPEAFASLFEGVLCEAAFLKRSLGASARDALEAARMVAIAELGRLRQQCAEFAFERVLYQEGPGDEVRGLGRELHVKALLVDWPLSGWLSEVAPRFAVAPALRGTARAQSLRTKLTDVANEDWWRNPRSGPFLKRAARDSGAESQLVAAAQRLVDIAAR